MSCQIPPGICLLNTSAITVILLGQPCHCKSYKCHVHREAFLVPTITNQVYVSSSISEHFTFSSWHITIGTLCVFPGRQTASTVKQWLFYSALYPQHEARCQAR